MCVNEQHHHYCRVVVRWEAGEGRWWWKQGRQVVGTREAGGRGRRGEVEGGRKSRERVCGHRHDRWDTTFFVVAIIGAGGGCLHTWVAYEISISVSSDVYIS
jgi:hypothetical protein